MSSNYAIIDSGGKQILVRPGRFYDLNAIPFLSYQKISFNRVLFLHYEDNVLLGKPYIKEASINGVILRHLYAPKLIVYKMRPKKKTRRKQGHRQHLTRILVNSIFFNGQVII
uniref:Large ribosomal subunit protein bL21m n=1 Tax=Gloeochaete wittrockiana TaxID=38269 RepID=A0A3G1IVR0_9EUKA|nr:ribosomal protein L21 [Gloeochaete wittrockiana]YP_009546106.1 ribosomal protein L21 [Gloeochaete wittrockiana]ASQ40130.1 ribosomal protein L21 [Gloeochaete wittrockiana]ASQ40167.1 ribosomal protein L21 [Gloeochaete wittrockiana]